jgi:thiazole synthase
MSLKLYNKSYSSRLLLGTARYPSPHIMQQAISASGCNMVTVSLRRQQAQPESGHAFWNLIKSLGVDILPNTAGCESLKEAITLAHMSRELFQTDFIKLEVIGDTYTLQPDMQQTLEGAKQLTKAGFKVLPYCTDDLVVCQKLVDAGCQVIMPWASPIGTGRGIMNPYALETLRKRLPDVTLIVDAGLGKASHVVTAFELGFDGVLMNTAIAKANDPIKMAEAFKHAALAGRSSYEAVPMIEKNLAVASTPMIGMPFRPVTENSL